jgi:hypothetical protein
MGGWRGSGWAVLPLLTFIASCAAVPEDDAWRRFDIAADGRLLAAAAPDAAPAAVLTVFVEGDGAAHHARGRPRRDPTPRDPGSLKIARAWPTQNKAWLGRLCQYTRARDSACAPGDWTVDRFSARAIAVTNAALDALKARTGARRLVLVGWSGGGTVAALAAAGRSDVDALVTIAAPLDLAAWTAQMKISPLPREGDPARLGALPMRQLHLYGGHDTTVPASGQLGAATRMGGVTAVWANERHACCWEERAAEIAALVP